VLGHVTVRRVSGNCDERTGTRESASERETDTQTERVGREAAREARRQAGRQAGRRQEAGAVQAGRLAFTPPPPRPQ
jgi:hypothetical protein